MTNPEKPHSHTQNTEAVGAEVIRSAQFPPQRGLAEEVEPGTVIKLSNGQDAHATGVTRTDPNTGEKTLWATSQSADGSISHHWPPLPQDLKINLAA